MEALLEELKFFQDISFPCGIYQNLTQYVDQATKIHNLPYSAYKTDKRRHLIYRCTFNSRTNYESCRSCLVFERIVHFGKEFYSFVPQDSNIQHNHSLNPTYYNAHRNCLPDEIIKQIQQQQQMGVLSGNIRSNLNITTNSNTFYNIRRPIISSEKKENFNQLINFIKGSKNLKTVIHEDDTTHDMVSLTLVNNITINSHY